MEAIRLGELPRPVCHRCGVVNANHTSIGCRSRGLTCGPPRATTDVEHVIVPPQRVGAAHDLVEEPKLCIVVHRANPMIALRAWSMGKDQMLVHSSSPSRRNRQRVGANVSSSPKPNAIVGTSSWTSYGGGLP